MKSDIESKDQLLDDYKRKIDQLLKHNANLMSQKEELETEKCVLKSKLVNYLFIIG